MYQRFTIKLSSWQSLHFLAIVLELSLLCLVTFLLTYLRGNHSSLNIPIERFPLYSIFVIVAGYPFLKVIWLAAMFYKAFREKNVSCIQV